MVRQTINDIMEIDTLGRPVNKYACREFSIEHSAKAFLDAMASVQTGER